MRKNIRFSALVSNKLVVVLSLAAALGCSPTLSSDQDVLTFIGKASGIFGCRGCKPEEIPDIIEITAELSEHFEQADINSDGYLTFEESQRTVPGLTEEQFASLDLNNDGLLSYEELISTDNPMLEGENIENREGEAEGELTEGELPEGEPVYFTEGSGRVDDPYILYTIEEIQAIGTNTTTMSAHYCLGQNIDASVTTSWNKGVGFIPIGHADRSTNEEVPFNGSFNGMEYSISNLYINASEETFVGLFGFISATAVIQNLFLESCNFTATIIDVDNAVGGLVGFNDSGMVNNCYVTGTISTNAKSKYKVYTGGLVGRNQGTISTCYSLATVATNNTEDEDNLDIYAVTGGLVGENRGTINTSYATGAVTSAANVTGSSRAYAHAGGLIGENNYEGIIDDCFATGMVVSTANAEGNEFSHGITCAGGLVGENHGAVSTCHATGAVSTDAIADGSAAASSGGLVASNRNSSSGTVNCYATGTVTANATGNDSASASAGGLIAWNDQRLISNCYSTGSVSSIANAKNRTYSCIGGLMGYNGYGTISSCHSTGAVSTNATNINPDGLTCVGGLVGENNGTVKYCYTTGIVESTAIFHNCVGGLVGMNRETVSNCYATSNITVNSTGNKSTIYAGGLMAKNNGTITNCYATGTITVNSTGSESAIYAGGLVAKNNYGSTIITNCYAANMVDVNSTGSESAIYARGLVADNQNSNNPPSNCFWDTTASSLTYPRGGTGLTTEEMLQKSTFREVDWNFTKTWSITPGETYPWLQGLDYSNVGYPIPIEKDEWEFLDGSGTVEEPYILYTIQDVQSINASKTNLAAHYRLGSNIDASSTAIWSCGEGFTPIGNQDTAFSGSIDGAGYCIYNLVIDKYLDHIGFLGIIGSTANIQNLGLTDFSISGASGYYAYGGFVGYNRGGTVKNCYASGTLSVVSCAVGNDFSYAGVLIGYNEDGLVRNCHATGAVRSSGDYAHAGGLIGANNGPVSKCYAACIVSARGDYNTYSGGLVGDNTSLVQYCFWDINTSGLDTSDGGTGLTTEEMLQDTEFVAAGWDFTDIWNITPDTTYPWLRSLDYSVVGYPMP